MKKTALVLLAVALGAALLAGCAKATCETIEDACGGGEDWIDECIEEYEDGDADCRKSIREYADCVDEHGCESESCYDEVMDMVDDC